jgi:hypothetical protein
MKYRTLTNDSIILKCTSRSLNRQQCTMVGAMSDPVHSERLCITGTVRLSMRMAN